MNREDAKYVINEIKWMSYYEKKALAIQSKIELIQMQIETATDPSSPQGQEYIGEGKSLSFVGKESYMLKKITERDDLIAEYNKWKKRFVEADMNYRMIVDQTDEPNFVQDYFSKKYSSQQLEEMYHTPKAFRKIVQLVMASI